MPMKIATCLVRQVYIVKPSLVVSVTLLVTGALIVVMEFCNLPTAKTVTTVTTTVETSVRLFVRLSQLDQVAEDHQVAEVVAEEEVKKMLVQLW
jgi:hypothetical protein